MSNKIKIFRESDTKIINIEFFLVMIFVGYVLIKYTNIHIAISLVLAFVSGVVLLTVFRTALGFIIVTAFFSLMWGLLAGGITYEISSKDWVWTIVAGVVAALMSYGAHNLAKRYQDNVEEY